MKLDLKSLSIAVNVMTAAAILITGIVNPARNSYEAGFLERSDTFSLYVAEVFTDLSNAVKSCKIL